MEAWSFGRLIRNQKAVQVIVVIVIVAVFLGLLLEGFTIIFKKSRIISKLNTRRKVTEEMDLNQPLTKKDLVRILEEIENIKAAINLRT